MDTKVIKTDPQLGGADTVRRAVEVLTGGGLVAFPTDTVYGVAARVDDRAALRRLRNVKSRKVEQAFTVHIGSPSEAVRFAPGLEGLASRFVRKAWPGPLTLIVPVGDPASAEVMSDLDGSAAAAMYHGGTIGLRCPDDPFAGALLRAMEVPVVAASANQAGRPAPCTGDDVLNELDGQIDLLVDTGRTKYARPSTIVRVTGSSYELVREGVYDADLVRRLSMLRLLLVCTGNTCRSPMAGVLARDMLAQRLCCDISELPERGVEVRSAGTAGGWGGASPNAMTVMERRGLDLSGHESAALTPEMIQQADHVFAMTRSHRDTIINMVPSAEERVALLVDGQDIRDPIGGSVDDYEKCARMAEKGLQARLQEVIV
ncbi:MAG: threonylcarbamoyl-AMP synthase [Phycisphaerales bacterium]|nr:MAG: threonylcarbamoyl-AMP synthase [Phycisphaerales bacterium]